MQCELTNIRWRCVCRQAARALRVQSHRARHSNIATTGIYAHELNRIENAGEELIDYRK